MAEVERYNVCFGEQTSRPRFGKDNEFNAVERSETYRVNSSARPSHGRGASRLLTAPGRTLLVRNVALSCHLCEALRPESRA